MASQVFVNWQSVVKSINDAALNGGTQILQKPWSHPQSFGPLAGGTGLLASSCDRRARHHALSTRPLLNAAAEHHVALVCGIKVTMEQERNETKRASAEIGRLSVGRTKAVESAQILTR